MSLNEILGEEESPRRKLAVNTFIILICWLAVIGAATVFAAISYFVFDIFH